MSITVQKEDIIILGTGGHAKCVIEIIEEQNKYNIIGITDEDSGQEAYLGYPILGNDGLLPDLLKKGVRNAAIGIGGYKDNIKRKNIFNRVKALGFYLPSLIHPSAVVSSRSILGEANIIFPGAVIHEARIGANNIFACSCNINHGSVLKDHVLISAGVNVGGDVFIDDAVLCAIGSTIISGVRVCADAVVGAGAVVVNDLEEEGTYLGCPAKKRGK